MHPADATTTSTTSYTGAPQGHSSDELRARFEAAHPVRWPSVSQERKAPPPKAPPGYEGPPRASPPVRAFPGAVADVTTETPEPRPLSAAPSTSVGTVSAGIMFPLATPADDLLPTFLTEEPGHVDAQRRASQMNVDTERASQEAAPTKSPPRSVVPVSESKRNRPYIPVSLEPDPEELFDRRPTPPTRVFVDSDGPPKGVHIIVLGGSPGSGVKTAGRHLYAALEDFGATVTTIDDHNFHVASHPCVACT